MKDKLNYKDYSLYRFLNEFNICIPLIQREYVQGIKDKNGKIKGTTNRLVDDIVESLRNSKKISLNIVYGFHEDNTFYPIDGQQRLTLMYLIHWYMAIRAETVDDVFNLKSFSYETRDSANEFFRYISRPNLKEWEKLFEKSNKNNSLINNIRAQTWFKVQWASDITIISVLNILEMLSKKIKKDEAKKFYLKLKTSKSIVCFDVLSEIKEDAKNHANTNYVRLNSRGKQLEEFENAKALLSVIENRLNKELLERFTYKYDQKYVDIFYEESQGDLYEKTTQINSKTILFLKNCYQLLIFIYHNKYDRKQLKDFDEYYLELYSSSKKSIEELSFFKEYIEFIDIVLATIYWDKKITKELKIIWEEELFYKNDRNKDENYLVANLTYIYYYYKFHGKNVKFYHLKELKYFLRNLRYPEIDQENFSLIETICSEISKNNEVSDYFSERKYCDIINDLLSYNVVNINDFKVRIREQSIKAKIISLMKKDPVLNKALKGVNYNFFDEIEKKSENKRQIYYFLYISNMWEESITVENIELLLRYIRLVEKYHYSDALKWKKWFAIATYYDESIGKLKPSKIINEEANLVYECKKNGERKNIHFWENQYYYIQDDLGENEVSIRHFKLNNLRKAYDILKQLDSDTAEKIWLRDKFDNHYDQCWLKYAIDREYHQLLENRILYSINTQKINIDVELTNNWGKIHSKEGDFFAYVYSLDKAKDNKCIVNRQYSGVYDIYSKNVRDTIVTEQFTLYEGLKDILNQFDLNLLWQDEFIVYPYNEGRKFFYYRFNVNFLGDEITLISSEDGKIKLRCFYNNEYDEFQYDISNEKKQIDLAINSFNSNCKEIKNLSVWDNERSLMERNNSELEDVISKNFKLCNIYTKNYERIKKYLYKDSFNLEISRGRFQKINGDERIILKFIGMFS